jgi:hypothetical protein
MRRKPVQRKSRDGILFTSSGNHPSHNKPIPNDKEIAHLARVTPSTLKSYKEGRYSKKANSVIELDAFFSSRS